MYRHNPPTIKIEFEHKIRNAHVWVEASAWHDDDGIYKTQLNDVFFDGTSVLELLTDDDLSDIDDAIEPAIHAESGDARSTGSHTIPGPYPTL
ncbi:hypothetical protein K0U83_19190 [bacterium]|nr:hypothetical protein [bacterium]